MSPCGLSHLVACHTVALTAAAVLSVALQTGAAPKVVCRLCENSSRSIERVAMPYVFKYLAAELAAMNIKVSVGVS
jgi:DNA-directed RNA polymerase I subunit RPA2